MTGDTVGAAIDIGSNSIHVLVARVVGHDLQALLDESRFLGAGDLVDATGELGPALRSMTVEVLAEFVTAARSLGASPIAVLGTEPIRRAADAARLDGEIRSATRLDLDTVSHQEEAYLTTIGVMGGHPVPRATLIVDIGGGSTEFCVVAPDAPARADGLQLGSARLTARHVTTDPPTDAAMRAMTSDAASMLATVPPRQPAELVLVGGTASNLLKVAPDAGSQVLTGARLDRAIDALGSLPSAEIAELHGVRPERARVLPAGAAIVLALLGRSDLDEIRVSEAGLREGAILAMAHAGSSWRSQLPELASGWLP